jgi:hypothetical protein
VQARISQLQTGCPYELKLLWIYTGTDYTEAQIHEEFDHERIRGEWFRPSRNLLWFINAEVCNTFKISTPNGRDISLTECWDGEDEIAIDNGIQGECIACRYHTIYNKFRRGELYIDSAQTTKKTMVNGQ